MAVVINDFEVLVEPPQDTPTAGEQNAAPPASTPQDVEQIVRRQQERAARVRAD